MPASPDRNVAAGDDIRPTTLTFLLIEGFSATGVVAAIEALQATNLIVGTEIWRWKLMSHDGAAVRSSAGLKVDCDCTLDEDIETDFLFVSAYLIHDPPYRQRLHKILRRLARRGIALGATSIGAFILARAGLLDGRSCTVQWEHEPAFREEFPEIELRPALFVIDRDRYTACGGMAGLDMVLQIIRDRHGKAVCQKVANNFHLERIREEGDIQRAGSIARIVQMPASLQTALRLMLERIEAPISTAELASHLNTSIRNFERTFKRCLGTTPARYYLSLRLEKARELLLHTNLSTLDVALRTGFASSSYFARCFVREFGSRPSDIRKPAPTGAAIR